MSANYKAQKESQQASSQRSSTPSRTEDDRPRRKDGELDMRYKVNQDPSGGGGASSSSSRSSPVPAPSPAPAPVRSFAPAPAPTFTGSATHAWNGNTSGPVTRSGQPDMRFKANRR